MTHVCPLLPDYYPAPKDARVERQILENVHVELQWTKILYNSSKLVWKCAILEAAILEIEADFTRFYWILGIKKKNVVEAVDCIRDTIINLEVRFVVPGRRKQQGSIPEDVKAAMNAWWTDETCISPNMKDIRQKRVGGSLYDTHLAHLLLKTQV